jgi:outer membrane receptor protein involved in Fe transport
MKKYCGEIVLASALLLGRSVAVAEEAKQYFHISEQQAGAAMLEFAQQAEVSILFPHGMFTDVKANRLEGKYELKEALEILLAGTDIAASVVAEGRQVLVSVDKSNNHNQLNEGNTEMNKSSRLKLLASTIVGIVAQGAGGAAAQAQEAAETPQSSVEEISITGSRIQRTGMTTPTPVTVMDRAELEVLAPGSLMDALDQLPQFMNSLTVEDAGGSTWVSTGGQSVVNMRGLEPQRTLVLLNGRRIVPSNHLGTVDINQFPQALIERTEVVTGGASAAYGSDAVAGVTNFILDTDFTGFEAMAQTGVSDVGDADNYRASLAGGFDLGERTHIVMGGDWFKQGGIANYDDRDWFKNWGNINFGDVNGVPNVTPQRVRYENVCSRNNTFGGLITSGPLAGTHFLPDGTPAVYQNGEVLDGAAMAGLNNRSAANPNGIITGNMVSNNIGDCDHIAYHNVVMAAQERASFLGLATIELNERHTLTMQVVAGRNEIENERGGYSWSGTRDRITIYDDNAFLDPGIRAQMQELGLKSFQMHKILPQDDPLNNAGLGGSVTTGHSVSGTIALEGDIFENWHYQTYYQYGEGYRGVEVQSNRRDHTYRAMEAVFHPVTGEIVCRSTLKDPTDGCVPYNVFGLNNQSPEVAGYFNDFMWVDSDITQHAAEFVVDGPIYRGWGAGEISLAAGASYRKEDLFQIGGDPLGSPIPVPPDGHLRTPLDANGEKLYNGLPPGIEGNNIMAFTNAPTIRGGYDVKEFFTEMLIPVIRGATFADSIDASLAVRWADYEGSGGIWAWKYGADWQVTDELRLRATRSRDVRAGNLNERFNATTGGGTVIDPLFGDDQYTISVHVGGNPNVNPEYSDTMTYGVVYQPVWFEGFSSSLDYYDISIKDAINQIGIDNIMEECYDRGAFCDQIDRGIDGRVQVIRNLFINLDEFRVRGADLELSYRRPVAFFGGDDESISLRVIASRMFESSITPYQSGKIERAGNEDFPDLAATFNATYRRGPLSLMWSERYRGEVKQDLAWVTGIDVDKNEIDPQWLTNVRINYDLDTDGGSYAIYASVNNLFDRNPSDSLGLSNIYGNIGRSYTAGVRFNF